MARAVQGGLPIRLSPPRRGPALLRSTLGVLAATALGASAAVLATPVSAAGPARLPLHAGGPGRVPSQSGPLAGLRGARTQPLSLWGATSLGPAPVSAPVQAQLYFSVSHPGQLQALAQRVSTPGSPEYHHYLSVAQFAARFGPRLADVQAVDAYLRAQGLSVGPLAANHLAQSFSGAAGRLGRALSVPMQRVKAKTGALLIGTPAAPGLPAGLVGSVTFIAGLTPWATPVSNLVRWPAIKAAALLAGAGRLRALGAGDGGPAPSPSCAGPSGPALTPSQLSAVYGLDGFYAHGQMGQGEAVGLIEYALADKAAIQAFQACTGSSATVQYIRTQPTALLVDPEVAADVEVVAALAPRATVDVYEGDPGTSALGPWELAISGSAPGGLPAVVSTSWSNCEPGIGLGGQPYYAAEQQLFEEAAAQGQTLLAASGDDGSEACLGETSSESLTVDDPASSPLVTGVGGTASDTATGTQYVWDSRGARPTACLGTGCTDAGASGGGASLVWPRPAYQDGLPKLASCTQPGGCREVPDVSALAGDAYAQYCSPEICGARSGWVRFGGTSLAAPSWAAALLLSDQACSVRAGLVQPLLYQQGSAVVGTVTSGNNDLTGTNRGLYAASASGGYSMAAGLGYLGAVDLSAGALCGTARPASVPLPAAPAPAPGAEKSCSATRDEAVPAPVEAAAITATEGPDGCAGYLVVTADGAVAAFGHAAYFGSLTGRPLAAPVIAMAATPGYGGYWLLSEDGGVFALGNAHFYGSAASLGLKSACTGLAPTPDGLGYWLVTASGQVLSFGDARNYGSLAGTHLAQPVTGLTATPSGRGYWLVGADGGVFGFGDARFQGSLAGTGTDGPIVGILASAVAGTGPGGAEGYRLVSAGGSAFSFGAADLGGLAAGAQVAPVSAAVSTPDGQGYYILDSAGHVYAYGDARYLGNLRGVNTGTEPIKRPRRG